MSGAVAVLLLIETDDARLQPSAFDPSSARISSMTRRAVLENLAHVSRIVAVMAEGEARVMCEAHDLLLDAFASSISARLATSYPTFRFNAGPAEPS